MAAQLNYTHDLPKGNPGGKYALAPDHVVTRVNEEEDGVLKFGMAVVAGTRVGRSVKRPATGAEAADFEGVVLEHAHTEQDRSGRVQVLKGATVSVLAKGQVWGRLTQDAAPVYGKPAYVSLAEGEEGCFTDKAGVDIGATFGPEADAGIAVIDIH